MNVHYPYSPRRLAISPFGPFSFGIQGLRGTCVNGTDSDTGDPCSGGGSQSCQGMDASCDVYANDYPTCTCVKCMTGYTPDISGACVASGSGNSDGKITIPVDNEYVTNCKYYDSDGNCIQCNAPYLLDNSGGYTGCVQPGSVAGPANGKRTQTPSPWASITNSLANMFRPSAPLNVSSAAACVAAKGTWTGTSCTPPGSISLGGATISTGMLLLGGVALLLFMKGRK